MGFHLNSLAYILISSFIISSLALAGFFSLILVRGMLENILMVLVSFAAGTLVGGAFFHLLPESIEQGGPVFQMLVVGIVVFFAIEMYLYIFLGYMGHAAHGHVMHHVRPIGVLNLIGDGIHNITDGVIIASSFLVSVDLGIITSVAVALHEIPQEVGDFAVLIYSGYSKAKALILNYIAALMIFVGAIGFYLFSELVSSLVVFGVPFAAGGFIYIAMADLLSAVKEEAASFRRKTLQFTIFVLGIVMMWYIRILLAV